MDTLSTVPAALLILLPCRHSPRKRFSRSHDSRGVAARHADPSFLSPHALPENAARTPDATISSRLPRFFRFPAGQPYELSGNHIDDKPSTGPSCSAASFDTTSNRPEPHCGQQVCERPASSFSELRPFPSDMNNPNSDSNTRHNVKRSVRLRLASSP